ncbi:MAG: Ig-like domain-containing protein [Paludibacteraceae bacterium]|nr:Ig-like domain-containing protein [Paludibacteraceae bacterium]
MKNNKLIFSVLILLGLPMVASYANHILPNQPLAADGKSYVVRWDCENSTWYPSNDMEYDETFVVAFDLTGTALLTWLQGTPAVQGMVRTVALNVMRDDQGNEYLDRTARMWRIRDNIYGAEVNFKQWAMKNGSANNNPATGTSTKIYARIFGVENGFGGKCNLPYIQGKTGKWYQWPSGWNEDYVMPNGSDCCFFTFAPYTGTKTEPIFTTQDKTGLPDIYYDKDHYVLCDGYAAPCMLQPAPDDDNCCPELEDLPATLSIDQNADTMVVLDFLTRKSGDYTFQWYSKTGTGSWTTYTGSTTETLQIPTTKTGTTQYKCKVTSFICPDGVESNVMTVTVNKEAVCPSFKWTVDNEWGSENTLMYPGGYYKLSCNCTAGPPTITVTGNNVYSVIKTKAGNATTVEVTLLGNASGDITITFESNVESAEWKKCEETHTVPVAECTETSAESRKIEWFNFKTDAQSWPEYWIHGGASVFLRDNNGKLEADIEHQDGLDQWYIIYTGEMCQGQKVFYMQNVQTMRYVYRGSTRGNVGGDWEYAEALLSETNLQTNDFKWVLYAHGNDTAIVNVDGFTGTNLTNGAYVLHVRNWEAPNLFSNPNIPSPRMVCGKMADQGGSPAFYLKGYTTTKPITQFQTTIAWQGTAPMDTILCSAGETMTYTVQRTDNLHSINKQISYRSTNPSIATVDANSGAVAVVTEFGECDIEAILETVGCFLGDTLRYHLNVEGEMPTYLKFDDKNGTHVWSDVKNWWPTYSRLPNDTDSAVVVAPCRVDIPTACTHELTFEVTTGYDITILPTGGLTITGIMTNAQAGDILIQSTAAGNGSLVYVNAGQAYPAKVEFYSAAKDGNSLNPTWQYVGHPLATPVRYGNTYTQPGTQIYIWDAQSDHSVGGLWYATSSSYDFAPFRGYCLTQATPTTYTYEGNLNAAIAQTLTIPYLDAEDYPSFYLISNSWTAPIRIADMEESDFENVDATIYIMNTGTYAEAEAQQSAQSTTGQAKQRGQYNAIPIHAAPYLPDALQVIPSMQGFFVHHSTQNQNPGAVILDYEQSVYSKTYTLTNEVVRAPRRMRTENITALHLTVENARWADAVDLLDGADFTDRFDQGWDARKMLGDDVSISLSVQTKDGDMAVAAMNEWEWVPLSLSCHTGLDYTFRALSDNTSNLYLYDKTCDSYTELTNGAEYTFRAKHSVENDRFYLCKGWKSTAEESIEKNMDGKYIINGHLIIIRDGIAHTALGLPLK